MPNARYDIPWKLALTHAVYDFLDFFFPDIGNEIDRKKRPRFRDKELAEIGYGTAPDVMVADKLVEVFLRDGSARWVLIHIEVQAQRDTALARRVRHGRTGCVAQSLCLACIGAFAHAAGSS